jgi:hypothetical protein
MKQRATVLFALLTFAAPAMGGIPCADLLNGGTMTFDYVEAPPGPINGSFSSDGVIVDAPPVEGTAAATFVLDGTNYAVVVGALEDGLNFVDGGVIVVGDPVNPITVGSYPLDGIAGVFVFVDDAVGWVPPLDLCSINWTLELDAIVAAGKNLSTSGTVTFTTVTSEVMAGTFECATFDPDTGVTLAISAGTFNIDTTTSVDDSSFGKVKSLYR